MMQQEGKGQDGLLVPDWKTNLQFGVFLEYPALNLHVQEHICNSKAGVQQPLDPVMVTHAQAPFW